VIEDVRFVKLGDGRLILQAYDGHVWFTPRVVDMQELGEGQKLELSSALELSWTKGRATSGEQV
jgi:hypothetical protein